jgi:hypothetical protein
LFFGVDGFMKDLAIIAVETARMFAILALFVFGIVTVAAVVTPDNDIHSSGVD